MIELGIVDLSADGRRRLANLIERWSWKAPDSRISTPKFSLHPLSPEEVRFHGSLDVCVVGPELVGCDAAFVANLRQQMPNKVLICILDSRTYSFSLVEQLGRLGVDDVLVDSASADEFFRRILLLQRRVQSKKRGRLAIVDSARGGVGKTFISAAVAEGWFSKGDQVCIVDCDVVSQDLTRFLQVRPFVNEGLKLLVEQQRVVTAETVRECVRSVWLDEPRFGCVAPISGGDDSLLSSPSAQRGFVAVIEALLLQYDRVVIDTSGLVSSAKTVVFQICDDLFFVVNRDASAAFANRQALSLIAGLLRPEANLTTVLNDNGVGTASIGLLKEQVVVIAGRSVNYMTVPRSAQGAAWACSGSTPYRALRRTITAGLSNPKNPPVSSRGNQVLNSFKVILVAFSLLIASFCKLLGVRIKAKPKTSASRDPWGSQPTLATNPLLSLGGALPEEGALISKPVMLG